MKMMMVCPDQKFKKVWDDKNTGGSLVSDSLTPGVNYSSIIVKDELTKLKIDFKRYGGLKRIEIRE